MRPLPQRIKDHRSGSSWSVQFTYLFNGAPVALDGVSIGFKAGDVGKEPVLDCSTDDGSIIITDSANGIFQVVPGVVSAPPGDYRWELRFTFADATVKRPPFADSSGTMQEGRWNIIQNIDGQ